MRALVLSGGGSKGAYQIGVLKKWMGEEKKDYQIMCGISVGALNIAGLSHVPYGHPKFAIDFMENFWLEKVNTKAIYKRWFPFGVFHSLWLKSVYDSSPLIKLVNDSVDMEKVSKCNRRLAVGAVNLDTGEYHYASEKDEDFLKWVCASASYPVFFNPVVINDQLWADGGIKHVTPIAQAIRMGASEIDVIMCSNFDDHRWMSESKCAVPDQIVRTLDIMSEQIIRSDLEITGLKNDLAKTGNKFRYIKINVVMPKQELISNSLNFDPKEIRRMMQIGYNDANSIIRYH